MDYTNKLHVVYDDNILGLDGKDFQYLFSYEQGGPESFKIKGKEWLYRSPRPTFWRATTDNDRGNGFNEVPNKAPTVLRVLIQEFDV